MPPGGDEHYRTAQDHPSATKDAPPHSTPPLPAIAPVASQKKKKKQLAASLPEGRRLPRRSSQLCRGTDSLAGEEAMAPRGDVHGRTVQDHPSATGRRDKDAPAHSAPPLPAIALVASQKKKQQHLAVSLHEGHLLRRSSRLRQGTDSQARGEVMLRGGDEHACTAQHHPSATVRRDEDAPPHFAPPLPAIAPKASQEKRQRHEHEQQCVVSLPEGPLVEILARVPYKSLCRFKCVSKPWLSLCSSHDIRRRSPQTLSGFFFLDTTRCYFHMSVNSPPLVNPRSYLEQSYRQFSLVQVCGGLLLFSYSKSLGEKRDFVVCNPATEEWTLLPPVLYPGQEFNHRLDAYIGFDAAVPSRFVVFASLTIGGNDSGKAVIYSSETGQWSYMQINWETPLNRIMKTCAFLNGTMHWPTARNSIVTVDSEGKVWREIKMPDDCLCNIPDCTISIGQSKGNLYACQRGSLAIILNIWVLEDYGTGKWTLEHRVNVKELFGWDGVRSAKMVAVHPDSNVIFLNSGRTIWILEKWMLSADRMNS